LIPLLFVVIFLLILLLLLLLRRLGLLKCFQLLHLQLVLQIKNLESQRVLKGT
jgi:hypothetical protein